MNLSPERLALVRSTFVAEARELLAEFEADLDNLARDFDDRERRQRICRAPHTIASAADMLGAPLLGQLAAVVEEATRRLREDGFELRPDRLVALREAHEALAALLKVTAPPPGAPQAIALVASRVAVAFAKETA